MKSDANAAEKKPMNEKSTCGQYECENKHTFSFFEALYNINTQKYHCPTCKSIEYHEIKEDKADEY